MAEASRFAKSLRSPFQWIMAGLILLSLVIIMVGPMIGGRPHPHSSPALQATQAINLAMYMYAGDHNNAYPIGKSSTEVFQKLVDEEYIADITIFYVEELKVPGKTKATSKVLKPENVCFDVTVPLGLNSSDFLPVIFSTGYRIDYTPGGSAVPLFKASEGSPSGICVAYHDYSVRFQKSTEPDGTVTNFIPSDFNPAGKKFQQLTPDGPLPP